ncbi:acyl-CoA dehydrogenase [Peribacillus frigoritolerans]|uniref:acyl-CoA dehydrogenase n=1 Tax=Peribacillus frigoritolerans TaxID=450367 RepID=UPI0021D125EE|nr:acyl-CoA dehydrogenase [Peribacillus frigoritolerans]MCU6598942.1 acyl-CoA dehydrogenase [Peribacillus frigoritolerans]
MDLSFSVEQEQFRQNARAWLEKNIPENWGTPYFEELDSEEFGKFQRNWDKKVYEGGYAGLAWPKEYGGQGLTQVEQIIFNEEAGKIGAPAGINGLGKLLLGPTMQLFGTDEQKKRFLPPLLQGEEVWCQGFSEPNAGSDLASLRTKAVLDGDEWVIDGQKVWTSYAQYADYCFVLGRTSNEGPKHKGITFFLVPMNLPGITVRPLIKIDKGDEFCEVYFDNVRIPKENVLGGVNNGWKVAMTLLSFERGTLSLPRQVGFLKEFESLAKIAQEAKSHDGTPVSKNPHYRQRLSEIYAEIRILRYHGLKTVSQLINDGKLGTEASLQKLFWSSMHSRMGELAIDLLGENAPIWNENAIGSGLAQEIYFTSRGETIYAGSTQIQKNIIAEMILGMPK